MKNFNWGRYSLGQVILSSEFVLVAVLFCAIFINANYDMNTNESTQYKSAETMIMLDLHEIIKNDDTIVSFNKLCNMGGSRILVLCIKTDNNVLQELEQKGWSIDSNKGSKHCELQKNNVLVCSYTINKTTTLLFKYDESSIWGAIWYQLCKYWYL